MPQIWRGKIEIEKLVAPPLKLNFDFYVVPEHSAVEFALSARNNVTEVEKDIFKALLANDKGLQVDRLMIVGKSGTLKRQSNPTARAIQDLVYRHHNLPIVIRELPA